MNNTQKCYIVKREGGTCEILSLAQVESDEMPDSVEKWGPFDSPQEAIARRVGLIRAGKCQPL